MKDVKLIQGPDGIYDISLSGNQIASVETMETAIIVSIFTDGRADASQVPDPLSRRGWIGDAISEVRRKIGSTLWLYSQARMTSKTVAAIKDAANEALRWFIDDEKADDITVSVTPGLSKVTLLIDFVIGASTKRYALEWKLS